MKLRSLLALSLSLTGTLLPGQGTTVNQGGTSVIPGPSSGSAAAVPRSCQESITRPHPG